jgi:hypothetical protein
LDDLPPVARKKTNRNAFPMIGTPRFYLSNLISFSALVNLAGGTTHPMWPLSDFGNCSILDLSAFSNWNNGNASSGPK